MLSDMLGLKLSWLAGCVLLGTVSALAAPASSNTYVAQADPNAAEGSVGIRQQGLSDKEKLKFASEAQEEMREGLADLQKRIEEARKAKDIVLLNCLNDKYSTVNSLLKVAETASILLQEALSQNNSQQADHQFRRVAIARIKARQALEAAKECVSDTESYEGAGEEPIVIVEGQDAALGPEPETDPADVVVDIVIPPPVSN